MHRGEIWWLEVAPPVGRRPAVLLSRDIAYRLRTSVTIALVTRTIRNIPTEVELNKEDGLPAKCVVNLDDIITVPKSKLTKQITTLSAEKIHLVNRAIIFAFDIKMG
jgi:mRNA interferase MazF